MPDPIRSAELHDVRFTRSRIHAWVAGAALAALLGAGVLAASASTPTRQRVLAQLERPAVARSSAAAAHHFRASFRSRGFVVALTRRLNRASMPDSVAVSLSRGGRPVGGARVSITYSMPSMGMWSAYTSTLAAGRWPGLYRTQEAVLGMAGRWRLRITVRPHGGAPFSVTATDRMPA